MSIVMFVCAQVLACVCVEFVYIHSLLSRATGTEISTCTIIECCSSMKHGFVIEMNGLGSQALSRMVGYNLV